MATPMFRDLSRALEAPEEGRELWSGIPAEEEPAYAEEMFRKASDAALARENALPKTGYVPAGTGPMVEPSIDSTMAPMPSGLRSRKPIDFTPDTTKLQGRLAGFLGGNQPLQGPGYARPLIDEDFASEQERARKLMAQDNASFARDIPVASAEGSKTLASTVPGSGGDDELGRLSMGQALVRALEGSGSVISGQNLRSGAADTLGERMKQIEALRAKREERVADVAQEQAQYEGANLATLTTQLAAFKDRPDIVAALQNLKSGAKYTKPSDFIKSAYQAVTNPPTVAGKEAAVGKTLVQIPDIQAGTAGKVAKTAEIGPEGKSKRLAREQAAALGWARFNAQSAEAAARAAEKAATTTTDSNAVRSELDKIQKITQKGGYVPLAAALEQADTAIADLGRPPSMAAQAKHALPGGDRFLNPEEKAYFNSVDKLKQMEQLAISGKVVSESERKEFVRQYGTSWYANPTAAAAYIDLLRQKTATQIRLDLATIRATPVGKEALRLYEAENGLTENAAVLKRKGTAARPVKPSAVPEGKTVLWNVAEGKWKAIPNDNVDAAVTSGKYER
jgi:hypothetical protein